MRASLRIGWLCAVLVAAGCAVDSDGDDGPETGVPTSAAAEAEPATATTAPSATTTPVVEPPTTAASPTEPETPEDPSPDEPSTTDPPTEDAPIASADKPQADDDPADLQPQDNEAESEPEATLTPEPVTETPLTWQGIPVVTVDEAVTTETDGAVRAPRLLSGFDDVEVLLHDRDRAWTFGPDGTVLHEWSFEEATPSVFPDGTGGIVYLQYSTIFHQAAPESDPEVLVACPRSCSGELLGVAELGESRDVVYTHRDHFETPEGYNPHYEDVLHRISLNTRETVRLGVVGGYEWGTANISVAGDTLFGYRSTEASQGWIGIDLQSGDSIARCFISGSHETGRDCPRAVTGFADDLAVAYIDFTDPSESERYEKKIRVLALRSREVDTNTHNIPIKISSEVACVLNLEVWEPVAVINTSTQGPCWYYDYTQPHRSVLADFSTGEVELYSHPGFLRLVPRTKAVSEIEMDTPLTWQGIPVIELPESAAPEADGTTTAPRLLRRFDNVEVLLHDRNHAWTFGPDGSVAHEWSFDAPSGTVFPDGAGGIVYENRSGIDDDVRSLNSGILHMRSGASPETVVSCTDHCTELWLVGVTDVGGSAEVVYIVESWPPLPDDAEYSYPTHIEVLHRLNLKTQESVELAPVGGWEWWFYNTIIVDTELFGAWGTDGGNGVVGYDLLDGSSTYGGFGASNPDCFDTNPSLTCPRFAFAFIDSIMTAFWDYGRTFVVSWNDRVSEQHQFTLPIVMPPEVNDIYGIEAWDSVLIINTVTREETPDSAQPRWLPYRAVLIDLESHETEIYSHPGVLRLVPRTAAG